MFPGTKRILIGVSGGLDSVVLTDLSARAGLDFGVAHCNFQLRGEESERDEKFVRELAAHYNKPFHLAKFDTGSFAKENKCAIQEAARRLRYEWFHALEQECGYEHTLVAHHADDNIETLLMNFFRGTGLNGLTSIPQTNVFGVHIVRPLLAFRRQQLVAYAQERKLQWVEDSSNAGSDYTRNLFRNDIIPLVQKAYPEAEENLLRNISRFQKINEAYKRYINEKKAELLQALPDGGWQVPLKKLMIYEQTSVPFEVFSDYGFSEGQVNEIMSLADSQSGKYVSSNTWQVIRHRQMLVIACKADDAGIIAIGAQEKELTFPGGNLALETIDAKDFKLVTDPRVAQLDASEISWPLILRRWKPGDYFYPLGLRKKKKLARFFIDQKLSKAQKENAWVIESGQRIVWIVGMRIDDRVKVTAKTKQVLLIRYIPK